MAASQPRPGRSRPSGGTWGLLLERTRHGDTYVLLFLLLLVTYFLVSLLPKATWSDVVQEVGAGLTLLLALRTSQAGRRLQQAALVAVLVGFVATLLGSLEGQLTVLVKAVFGLLLLITPFVILGRV
ncbi:MAG TPA: hypothetical protein VE152_03225, partial [Acidimicrobiales bacterium]|nr:hypothetical protein [Acidimicrobiales bacterium]